MSAKWNLLIDVERCTGCRNCFIAVKDEYVGNEEPGYFAPQPVNDASWLRVEHHERGEAPYTEVTYLPVACQHCDDAPCMKAARDGAVRKRADGIVVIDPVKAKGERAIVDACPYGAVCWNEALQLPQSWPFDAHLLDQGWTRTRAEQVCPTGALRSVKAEDGEIAALARSEGYGPLRPELNTRPRLHYRGLARLNTMFIAGALDVDRNGRRDVVQGARISLLRDGKSLAEARSDELGDFILRGLAVGAPALLRIEADGLAPVECEVAMSGSVSLGRTVMGAASMALAD